jgi:5-methyltetrahydropteroyltriglutamate--homocysteine methyltransferase
MPGAVAMNVRTTHTGSLPRPERVLELLTRRDARVGDDELDGDLAEAVDEAVHAAVARQVELGIDIVNDGELGKVSYATYVADRMEGFDIVESDRETRRDFPDIEAFPDFAHRRRAEAGRGYYAAHFPVCTAPVAYTGLAALETELATLRSALDAAGAGDAFVTAASPGVIAMFIRNRFYASRAEYVEALGVAMRTEYEAIHAAGFTLQLDCPDLAFGVMAFADDTAKVHRHVSQAVEVLNAATAGIPPEAMRLHVCWGNYEGPHHLDVPLEQILDDVLAARPAALVLEAANPRHEHEWAVFAERGLPDGKTLVPGLVDSTSNYVEHPDLVAQRLRRFVDALGAERVIAGTDCGFGTIAGRPNVVPSIVDAKLAALVEGTRRLG